MTLPIRLLPIAIDELNAGVDWYESKRDGFGEVLLSAVRELLRDIANNPRMHGVVYRDVRKAVVRQFPYVIMYRLETTEIVVISIFHTSRDPSVWKRRV